MGDERRSEDTKQVRERRRAARGQRDKEVATNEQKPDSNEENEPVAQADVASRSNGGGTDDPLRPFLEAYQNYYQALRAALDGEEVRQRYVEISRRYEEEAMKVGQELQQSISTVNRILSRPPSPNWLSGAHPMFAAQASQIYVEFCRAGWAALDVQQRAAEAYRRYLRDLGEAMAPTEVQDRAAEAYRGYLEALRAAWTGADLPSVGVSTLVGIGRSTAGAAWLTMSASASLRQRWLMAAALGAASPNSS